MEQRNDESKKENGEKGLTENIELRQFGGFTTEWLNVNSPG
jgi:hypothetical protein